MAPAVPSTDKVIDPLEGQGRLRRRLARIGLPIAAMVLVIGSILVIALYTDRANRAGVLGLSGDLIDTLQHRVAEQVAAYLQPAARAVRIARGIAETPPFGSANREIQERHAAALLRTLPQVALFSLADAQGNYLMVRRGEAPGGIDTKLIRNQPAPREVTWTRRDAADLVIGTESDPTDNFDPLARPWYRAAAAAADLAWTDVYVFFTDRRPGITVSTALRGTDGAVTGVVGLDIELGTLSEFLAGLQVGRSGNVVIVDGAGRLIAHPDPDRMMLTGADGPTTARLDELGDPVLTRAFDHLRLERTPRRTVELNGERFILAASPLPSGLAGHDWTVLVTVPEADFAGFVSANNRTGLAMSGVVVLIAGCLAMFLIRQGLRADRAAQRLLDREHAITAQSSAFARLAAQAGLFDPASDAPRLLTAELAEAVGARRASVWRLIANGNTLRCEDAFDRETAGHTTGAELHREELSPFFRRLDTGQPIATVDAAAEPDTAALHQLWLHPLGSRGLVAVPVMRGSTLVGAVWVEDPPLRTVGTEDFLRAVANMLALRLGRAAGPADGTDTVPAATSPGSMPLASEATTERQRTLVIELALHPLNRDDLAAEVFPEAAVMVMRFTDPRLMAQRQDATDESAPAPLADGIACALQEVADMHGIGYLRLLADQVVAAAGFAREEAGGAAALRIAAAALEMRGRCATQFEAAAMPMEFRIGIDVGVAIGSAVGRAKVFNLWGDAVRTADQMALSAPPGTIQVTEATYAQLRQAFLFRPRGSFWLPRVGQMRTYVLAGVLAGRP